MGKKKRKRKKADQKGFTHKKKNQLSLKMWLLPKLSNLLLEYLFILRTGRKKGRGTPELRCFSVFTFGVSKSFPKSNRQFHVHMPSLVFQVKLEEMVSKGKEKKETKPLGIAVSDHSCIFAARHAELG